MKCADAENCLRHFKHVINATAWTFIRSIIYNNPLDLRPRHSHSASAAAEVDTLDKLDAASVHHQTASLDS